MRGGEKRLDCPGRIVLGATPGSTTSHSEASSRGACAAARSATSITSIPSGRAASSRARTDSGSRPAVREISRILGLAGSAGGRPARVRDLGMRRETGRVRDRQASPPNPTLHRTRDIPMTRESHPATLSVPDHQPLNRWQRRWSRRARRLLTRHRQPSLPGAVAPPRCLEPHGDRRIHRDLSLHHRQRSAAAASSRSVRPRSRCPSRGRLRTQSTASTGSRPPRRRRPGSMAASQSCHSQSRSRPASR